MEEKLVSFETAKLAKEKGFNINVLYYCIEPNKIKFTSNPKNGEGYDFNFKDSFDASLSFPTQSLLQRWLRDKHRIVAVVAPFILGVDVNNIFYDYAIYYNTSDTILEHHQFNSYEEALETALQEALKLI